MRSRRPPNRTAPAPRAYVICRRIGADRVYLAYRFGRHFWTPRQREALPFVTETGAAVYHSRRDLGACEVVVADGDPARAQRRAAR